jgi:hypothetical protein
MNPLHRRIAALEQAQPEKPFVVWFDPDMREAVVRGVRIERAPDESSEDFARRLRDRGALLVSWQAARGAVVS